MFSKSKQLGWGMTLVVGSLWGFCTVSAVARAEIFKLTTGGEVSGELVNREESPRLHYVIRPYAGGEITLAASQVTRVVPQRPVDVEYQRQRLKYGDSVQDHWELAEWCRGKRLKKQNHFHLEQILLLDSDHEEARRLLGYKLVDGKWITREEQMKSRGYVKYNGSWVLPQEAQVREKQKKEKQLEKEWYEKIKRYHYWLSGAKRARAKEHLLDITDPRATNALARGFEKSKLRQDREIYARALTNVATPQAFGVLVKSTLENPDLDFRDHCLELLERHKPRSAVVSYVKALQHKDNQRVNRAAVGLAFVGNKSVIDPLVDALITTHKQKIGGENPGAISTSFGGVAGTQSSGFSSGGGPKIVIRTCRNEQVLKALCELTGKDFDYDQAAWRAWNAIQKPPPPKINSRRDD